MTSDNEGYYTGPEPGAGWIRTGLEQCDIRCAYCHKTIPAHIIVGTHRCVGGIEYVVRLLQKNGVLHICEECYKKAGLTIGKLDKVNLK
jgi:hypothetical protein